MFGTDPRGQPWAGQPPGRFHAGSGESARSDAVCRREGDATGGANLPQNPCYYLGMKKLDEIEKDVRGLSPEELADFRAWFLEYDAAERDRQIASDAKSGKLDALMREAREQYDSGTASEV